MQGAAESVFAFSNYPGLAKLDEPLLAILLNPKRRSSDNATHPPETKIFPFMGLKTYIEK
jgi:hypothetical protein